MSERLKILEKQILATDPLVMIGGAVRLHGQKRLERYASQISEELVAHPNTMLQYSPEKILAAMIGGRSVVVSNPRSDRLLAFAQIWEYGENDGRKINEFGSWLSFKEASAKKGSGKLALLAGISLHRIFAPEAQLIAIVEQDNMVAQKVLVGAGGIEIPGEFSPVLRAVEGEAAWMKRYDITQD